MINLEENFKRWLISQGLSEKTPANKPSTVYDYLNTINTVCKMEGHITWEELALNLFNVIDNCHGKTKTALNKYNEFLYVTDIPSYIRQQRNTLILSLISMDATGKISIDNNKDFFTPGEVAGMLRVSERTLQRWRQKGIGPKYRRDNNTGRIMYPTPYLEKYLNESIKKI